QYGHQLRRFLVDKYRTRMTDDFFRRSAQHSNHGWIGGEDYSCSLSQQDAVGDRIENMLELRFRHLCGDECAMNKVEQRRARHRNVNETLGDVYREGPILRYQRRDEPV